MTSAGIHTHSRPTPTPAMMLVAGPVFDASAIDCTGRYWYSV